MENIGTDMNTRYLAIDLHKRYLVIGGVNREQEVILKPRKITLEKWSEWAKKHLQATDEVVIEATGNTWPIVDELKPLVASVVVAHPRKVKLIAAARVKTDRIDVISLAHLLAANLVPEVWVPPVHVRELRRLISQRFQLTQARVRIQNEAAESVAPPQHRSASRKGNTFSGRTTVILERADPIVDRQVAN